jgi:hypothetical protein
LKPQKINDGLFEVVGIRSSFHLGNCQTGLASPVIIAQGAKVVITTDTDWPVQVMHCLTRMIDEIDSNFAGVFVFFVWFFLFFFLFFFSFSSPVDEYLNCSWMVSRGVNRHL